jgi:nitrate reductase NapE component
MWYPATYIPSSSYGMLVWCMICMHYLPPTNTQMDDAPTECMYPRCMCLCVLLCITYLLLSLHTLQHERLWYQRGATTLSSWLVVPAIHTYNHMDGCAMLVYVLSCTSYSYNHQGHNQRSGRYFRWLLWYSATYHQHPTEEQPTEWYTFLLVGVGMYCWSSY